MKNLTLIDKAFLLKRTPIFSSLDLDLLLTVADKLGLIVSKPGETLFTVNEEANRMYFIIKGQVNLRTDSQESICTLEQGSFFGEEALFNNKPRSYEAFTPVETHFLTLSRTNLFTIISECPSVALNFLSLYTSSIPYRPIKPLEESP